VSWQGWAVRRRFFNCFRWRNELISKLWDGTDIAGAGRIVSQCRSYLRDAKVQAATEINERALAPYGPSEFIAGDDAFAIPEQEGQHSGGLLWQTDNRLLPP